MGLDIQEINSWNNELGTKLSEWESRFGDGDALIERSDFLRPRQDYELSDIEPIISIIQTYSNNLWKAPAHSGTQLRQSFYNFFAGGLSHLYKGQIFESLKDKADAGVVLGSSTFMGTEACQIPAAVSAEGQVLPGAQRTIPYIFLGMMGAGGIGLQGFKQDMPGPIKDYIEGKKPWYWYLFPDIAYIYQDSSIHVFGYNLFNDILTANPDSPFQIINAPGLPSALADINYQQLAQENAPGLLLYEGFVRNKQSLFERAQEILNKARETQKRSSPIIVDGLGENELLFAAYNESVRFPEDEFRNILEARIAKIKKIPGALYFRLAVPEVDYLFQPLPEGHEINLITGEGFLGYKKQPTAAGVVAIKTVADHAASGNFIHQHNALSPERYQALKDYIQRLRKIEREVTMKYEVPLLDMGPYLDAMAKKLGSMGPYLSYDGLHLTAEAQVLLAIAMALEVRDELQLDPTEEALESIQRVIQVKPSDVKTALLMEDKQAAFKSILDKASIHQKQLDPIQSARAAELFSMTLNVMGDRSLGHWSGRLGANAMFYDSAASSPSQLGAELSLGALFAAPIGPTLGHLYGNLESELGIQLDSDPQNGTFYARAGTSIIMPNGLKLGNFSIEAVQKPKVSYPAFDFMGTVGLGFDPAALGAMPGFGFGVYYLLQKNRNAAVLSLETRF